MSFQTLPRELLSYDRARKSFGGPPALLLLGGLNTLRPLGMGGIPVINAVSDPESYVLDSRFHRGRLVLPPLESEPERVLELLLAAGAELSAAAGGRIPLYFGADETLLFLDQHREALSRYFLFLLNEPKVARALLRKDEFEALALDRGLRVPRTLRRETSGNNSIAAADFPVLVKPSVKVEFHESPLFHEFFRGCAKARIFKNGKELLASADVEKFKSLITVQQYIPGGDDEIYSFHGFASPDSAVLASFCGRKIRTYPKLVGESSYLELIHHDRLTEVGRSIVRGLGLRGVFKIDLKRNPDDGQFYMLEVNARFNLWHYLGAANGINLPRIAYDYLVDDITPPPISYSTRCRWLKFDLDRQAFKDLRRRGELSIGGWLGSILGSRKVYSLFSWRDPKPWMLRWGRAVRRRLR